MEFENFSGENKPKIYNRFLLETSKFSSVMTLKISRIRSMTTITNLPQYGAVEKINRYCRITVLRTELRFRESRFPRWNRLVVKCSRVLDRFEKSIASEAKPQKESFYNMDFYFIYNYTTLASKFR